MGLRHGLRTRNRRAAWIAPFFLILAGAVSNPAFAKTEKNCIQSSPSGKSGYYIGDIRIGSEILREAYLDSDLGILLFYQESDLIEFEDPEADRARRFKIVYVHDDCEFYATPFFGNSNSPVILAKKEEIYIYFKSKDNLVYSKHDEDEIVYGAGFYKVNVFNKTFEKIEISPEMTAVLEAYGENLK